jgi:alpha-L-fucosidase
MGISRREALGIMAAAGAAMGTSKALAQAAAGGSAPNAANGPVMEAGQAATQGGTLAALPPAPVAIEAPAGFGVAAGKFQPTWESLSAYEVPEWYRDAKFGIWAHWGPQCQPEMGDWYAQKMYKPTDVDYRFHCARYGHPSKFGFKDVIHTWQAERWEPEHLIGLYKKAGAKFFAAMANHHDNFDMFDSTYQPWNSVKIGPKKDIVGGWMKAARAAGLKFAISSHGDRAWSWYQDAQRADAAGSGSTAGVPYDGLTSREQGKGQWWEGLDPQDLYAQYHELGRYNWPQTGNPPLATAYIEKFFNRTIDLINKYEPDLLYFDDTVLPIYPASDIGLRIMAYLYNTNMARNGGKLEAVMTGKGLNAEQRKALVLDLERGVSNGGEVLPWQTDTCIGDWHYRRSLYEQRKYKTARQVVQMLIDIVSKNGNLMLSIPVRGEGTIDSEEEKVLAGLGSWMEANGEGIYATRPFEVYGEGPSTAAQPRGQFGGARDVRGYTSEDVRYTKKGEAVYAFVLDWPTDGKAVLKTLAEGAKAYPGKVGKVELLGSEEGVKFTRDGSGLVVSLPESKPNAFAYCLKISGG